MNCCDQYGDCRQGRDCPVRVARIKQRFPDADPLPPDSWRDIIRTAAGYALVVTMCLWLAFIVSAFLV